jgi:hypothetical protein
MSLHEVQSVSALAKYNLVKAAPVNGKQQYTHYAVDHGETIHDHSLRLRTYPANPVPPTNALSSTSYFEFKLDRGAGKRSLQSWFRLRLLASGGDAELISPQFWFNYCEVWAQNGTKNLGRFYFEAEYFEDMYLLNNPHKRLIAEQLNINPDNSTSATVLKQDTSRDYYIRLRGDPISKCQVQLSVVDQFVTYRFFPIGSIVASGAGTVSLTQIDMISLEMSASPNDEQAIDHIHKTSVVSHPFVEPILVSTTATLTADQALNINLNNLHGWFSHFLIVARLASETYSNHGLSNYVSFGKTAQIDLLDPTQQSVFGQGSAPTVGFLQSCLPQILFTGSNPTKPCVVVPFGHPESALEHGIVDGCQFLDGKLYVLRIIPKSGTAQTWTVTPDANASSGRYSITFETENGEFSSTDSLAYNANAATIQSAVNAMEVVRKYGLTVNANQGLSAGAVTLTQTSARKYIPGRFRVRNEALGTTASIVSAIGTPGIEGISSGSNYIINVYAYRYNKLYWSGPEQEFSIVSA